MTMTAEPLERLVEQAARARRLADAIWRDTRIGKSGISSAPRRCKQFTATTDQPLTGTSLRCLALTPMCAAISSI
jgi:hypothetical protein